MEKIKKEVKIMMICMLITLVVLLVCWVIIHRRVIKAWIKGEPLPEAPEWHKKCFAKLGCKI